MPDSILLVATPSEVLRVDAGTGAMTAGLGLEGNRPTDVTADPFTPGRAWCATARGGVFRTEDGGFTWTPTGLTGEQLMTISASPARRDLVWAGTEPSAVWRSDDGGASWRRTASLETLPSSPEWAFPPRPDTHHIRWIASHPTDADRLWAAVEAGALIRTRDGGESWLDRASELPYDTHELAVHPAAPDLLHSAAGDGFYVSRDAGQSWAREMAGMEVAYFRSVAIDPGDPTRVIASGSTGPRTAYVSGRADGRVYRREGDGDWRRVTSGWPREPSTIAPLLRPGWGAGEMWAADERGIHRSEDGGERWSLVAAFDVPPDHLRGLAALFGEAR